MYFLSDGPTIVDPFGAFMSFKSIIFDLSYVKTIAPWLPYGSVIVHTREKDQSGTSYMRNEGFLMSNGNTFEVSITELQMSLFAVAFFVCPNDILV